MKAAIRRSVALAMMGSALLSPSLYAAGTDPADAAVATAPVVNALLADAAESRDAQRVDQLLKGRADPNLAQADGTTALHWAVRWQQDALVDKLLKAGANPKAATRFGATPLYLAAVNGNAAEIRRLVKAGVDVNATVLENGETPLMFAARTGNPAAVAALLDAGAAVNAREKFHETTALMWAAEEGQTQVVQLLMKHGADSSIKSHETQPPAPRGRPARPAAADAAAAPAGGAPGAAATAPAVAKAAAPAGAATPAVARAAPAGGSGSGAEVAAAAQQASFFGPAAAKGGLTPLVLATREGHLDTIKALLDGGADINLTTADGTTALLVATQNADAEAAQLLISRGADVNRANSRGWNPLYMTVKARSLEKGTMPNPVVDLDALYGVIEALVAKGADVNIRVKADTEVHNAIRSTWLHEAGATPFLRASLCGDLQVMKFLLAHGADPRINTEDGTTALMALAGVGYTKGFMKDVGGTSQSVEAMKLLLDAGIDVNAKTKEEVMALHGAAHKNFVQGIQLLVDHGADLTAHSMMRGQFERGEKFAGNTVLDWADGIQTGMESAIYNAEAVTLLEKLMKERNIPLERLSGTVGGKLVKAAVETQLVTSTGQAQAEAAAKAAAAAKAGSNAPAK